MRTLFFVFIAGVALTRSASAQAPDTNVPTAAPTDPAKVAEYQKRFQEGYTLEKAGQLAQARSVYDGILAEQPDAKRSLLEAGRVSLELNEPLKADDYLDRLHAIVPDFPDAIELLIQANETLHRDVKADRLVREYRALYDRNQANFKPFFNRERIPQEAGSEIVISQFFDYTQPPNYALKAELRDVQHQTQRVLLLKYDPDGTKEVRAKDPKLANDEVFILAEPVYTGERMTRINVYRELLSTPEYAKARTMLLGIFATSPKPIYSTPVKDDGP